MGQELEAAAAACGASPVRRLFTITLPLLRPSIVFAAGVVFLLGMGQFTVPLLLGRPSRIDVLTTEMFYLTLSYPIDYGRPAAPSPATRRAGRHGAVTHMLLPRPRRLLVRPSPT